MITSAPKDRSSSDFDCTDEPGNPVSGWANSKIAHGSQFTGAAIDFENIEGILDFCSIKSGLRGDRRSVFPPGILNPRRMNQAASKPPTKQPTNRLDRPVGSF